MGATWVGYHLCFKSCVFALGHGRRIFASSSPWERRRDAVSESPGDFGEGGEDPQTDDDVLCRGNFLADHATSFCRLY